MQQKQILKNATDVKKVDLASLNSNVDKLNIDKSEDVPSNLNILKSKSDKLDVKK